MKRCVASLLILFVLCGCAVKDNDLDQAVSLRKNLLAANNCTFDIIVTADYGDVLYTFQMNCSTNVEGNMTFTVTDPESIAGITGNITKDNAALSFDDKVLAFPMLAENQLTPVSAPWIFLNTLKSGYITGCSREENGFCIFIDDTVSDNPLHLDIFLDNNAQPEHVDFYWKQQRVLSADIRNFSIQ